MAFENGRLTLISKTWNSEDWRQEDGFSVGSALYSALNQAIPTAEHPNKSYGIVGTSNATITLQTHLMGNPPGTLQSIHVYIGKREIVIQIDNTDSTGRKVRVDEIISFARGLNEYESKEEVNEDFIFPDEIGGPIDYEALRRCVLYPLMDELKIERGKSTHGFHIWRHTAATLLHGMTGDIETAQKALGHASRSTTENYYDHADVVVSEATTSMLLDWLTDSDYELLERTDTVH